MIDDETAVKVADGNVEVVSEGNWKLRQPYREASEFRLRRHTRSPAREFGNDPCDPLDSRADAVLDLAVVLGLVVVTA